MSLTDSLKRLPDGIASGRHADAGAGYQERLLPCLPGGLRRYLARRDRRLVIHPEDHSARLVLTTGEAAEPAGILSLDGTEPLPAAAATKDRGRRTVLMLPGDGVLVRRTSFPAQVRNNLGQAIESELARLSPFNPDQVFYTFRVLPGARGEQRIQCELALCRRDRVQPWIKRLAQLGVALDALSWDGAWHRANLLPQGERRRSATPWLAPVTVLLASALLLTAAVLVSPLWQRAQILEALEKDVRAARSQAIEVDDLRQELERARQGSTAVLQQKLDQPRFIDLLLELTERIPDDTWIQSMELRNGQIQLRGESGQATELIATLESAPGIDNVAFRSPVTKVARTGKERFNLAFTYDPEPGP